MSKKELLVNKCANVVFFKSRKGAGMSDKDGSQWWQKSWNPTSGCTPVSEGCANCWARRMALRSGDRDFKPTFHPDRLDAPLHWRKPQTVAVCLMGDLFHEDISDDMIFDVFWTIRCTPGHAYFLLTKRPERISNAWSRWGYLTRRALGVSCENQKWADIRIPLALNVPAKHHFVSLEPLLSEVDVSPYLVPEGHCLTCGKEAFSEHQGQHWVGPACDPNAWEPCGPVSRGGLDWVVVGCESGPGRRPCKVDWVRSIVQQCKAAGVPVWVKQLDVGGKCSRNVTEWPEDLRVREHMKW